MNLCSAKFAVPLSVILNISMPKMTFKSLPLSCLKLLLVQKWFVLSDVFQSTSVYKDLIEIKLFCVTGNVFHLNSLC